ncbi:hypothetical protein RN001_016094 [Aquatica leii]|uniref:Endothelin-converting enzyme 1 n=1 Tax=Aquatica leii TaxID=1421715 RepID=A0AAN7PY22_9COLE|nr:hypothetical protein RN001_016094 [Aquatica leii]
MLEAIDKYANPCEDFYQYACGGWIRSNPIPDWTASWDRLARLRESLVQQMRQLLEKGEGSLNKTNEPSGVRKARIMYRTCMKADKLSQSLDSLEKILKAVGLPEHPSLFNNTNFDWLFTIAKARRLLGVSLLYGFNVAEDVRNSSKNKIVIEQINPGFTERYLLQPEKFSQELLHYKMYIAAVIKEYANYTNHSFVNDVINVSTEIAKVMTPAEIRRSPGYLFHEVTLVELANGPSQDNDTWRTTNWTTYLRIIFDDTNVVLNPQNDTVILFDLPFMKNMANLIKNTDIKVLKNYLWWSIFSKVSQSASDKYRSIAFDFSQKLLGVQEKIPKWKRCVSSVNANFGMVLSYLYIRSYTSNLNVNKVLQMLHDIKNAFEGSLHNLEWMDEVTREKMLIKLQAIRAFVGYPGWIMNATELDKHYNQAHVIEDELFETYLNLTNASIKRNLESLRKTPDRNRWVGTATTVNAFYSATLNSVTFPAAILNPPFYGNGIAAIDYGSIGAIMGHEITHGFDDQGRRYDEHGNLKQWWSLTTLEHYYNKVKCIIEQYNNYSMPELGQTFPVHGYNTQGENIADNGGLRAAFDGYKQHRLKTTLPQKLPGLSHLTGEQLFFLGFAQIWCGNSTVEALKAKIITGEHSPNRIRVLGTLKNSEEFSNAWNCPVGSDMNPKKKCVLW